MLENYGTEDLKEELTMIDKSKIIILFFCCWFPWNSLANQLNTHNQPKISNQVDEIIEEFVQASGGFQHQEIRSERRKGILIRGSSGPVPFEITAVSSGKWHYHQDFAYGDKVNYGFDGEQAWIQDTQRVTALSKEECFELAVLLDIRMPFKLKNFFPEMKIKGSEKIKGIDAIVISVTSPEGFQSELAFDVSSGLLLRFGDLFFEDYRTAGKVKRPFTIFFGKDDLHDSLRLKMQVSKCRQNVDIDESIFLMPACTLLPGQPHLYKLRKEVSVDSKVLEALVGVYQSDEDPKVFYSVTTQGDHLIIERTGWGTRFEILPETETDYFMRFLNQEFHFIKDEKGQVILLELGDERTLKAKKIK
jgi:hypothetical protein